MNSIFFAFYFLPIGFAAWYLGGLASVVMAVVSSLVWFAANAGQPYSSQGYAVWNTVIRLVSFLAFGISLSRLKMSVVRERAASAQLRKSLSEIKVLEAFLPICSECKKIRNQQGDWQRLEAYISERSDTHFSHGYCPECAKKALAAAGLTDDTGEASGGG